MSTPSVTEIMSKLAESRPIFHSEADFQHALAWEIHNEYNKAKIRLEYPIEVKDQRAVLKSKKKKDHIDILASFENSSYFFELKYKKKRIENYNHGNETFNLSDDSARDIGRYDYIKDIIRLESHIKASNDVGYAILLTNDPLYWNGKSKQGKNSELFYIHEGIKLNNGKKMEWVIKGTGTSKGREESHTVNNDYEVRWRNYSKIEHKGNILAFRYLLLEIKPSNIVT